MPAIKDIQSSVEIASTVNIDCDTAQAQWAAASNSYIPGTLDTKVVHRFSCGKGADKTPFPKGAIAGIIVGLLI